MTSQDPVLTMDLMDRLAQLQPGDPTHRLRHWRDKVALATEACYAGLFDPHLKGLTLAERLLVALYACVLTPSAALTKYYADEIASLDRPPSSVSIKAIQADDLAGISDVRLKAILQFTRTLILNPIAGDQALLNSLPAAGLDTPSVVILAQLIAFLSYQTRLLAGVSALNGGMVREAWANTRANTRNVAPKRKTFSTPVGTIYSQHGFTNASLEWKAWLNTVDVTTASEDQLAVLKESHPKAMSSDYYLFLVHQPEILRQRSIAFNAIMYAPGGMSRAERELGATVVSRINGCVYCASVHAQRYEQMAKRNEVIRQVFDNPHSAGDSARDQAIVDFSIVLTISPESVSSKEIEVLSAQGLSQEEILDLIHSLAIFAWANRLMLNLGEPIFEVKAVA